MNEITLLKELVWNRAQDGSQAQQTFSAIKVFIGDLVTALQFPFAVALILLLVLVLCYQPRIPRFAIWVPVFGLFGGTPKLYIHSRPPSLFGRLVRSRHRLYTSRKRR